MQSSVVMLGLLTGLGGAGAFGGCGFSSPGCEASFASQVDTCTLVLEGDLSLSGTITYDTGPHELKVDGASIPVAHMTLMAGAGEIDAILAHNVRLTAGAKLRAIGMLPFAIVASGSITLEDGSSIDVGNGGAGARSSCATPPMPGGDNAGGGAGGGGGGYGAAGGKGGDGNGNGQPQDKTTGGTEGASSAMPMGPVGGCPGANGGRGGVLSGPLGPGGAGGLGGGALYLVAADRIELGKLAVLTAGGGGGHGGGQNGDSYNAGGGGGGSGGMIFLESLHVIGQQAQVAANGGGGGEGADIIISNVLTPHAGKDGETGLTSTSRAPGGTGGAQNGVDGGRGGSREVPAGDAAMGVLDSGGGGGGGGVGFVHIVPLASELGMVSPAAN
jgi:hypothetical protein